MDAITPHRPQRTHLLKASEVQAMLGVSRSWLYDAATSGRLPSVRLGGPDGPLRFHPDDLDAWITAQRGRSAVESRV